MYFKNMVGQPGNRHQQSSKRNRELQEERNDIPQIHEKTIKDVMCSKFQRKFFLTWPSAAPYFHWEGTTNPTGRNRNFSASFLISGIQCTVMWGWMFSVSWMLVGLFWIQLSKEYFMLKSENWSDKFKWMTEFAYVYIKRKII